MASCPTLPTNGERRMWLSRLLREAGTQGDLVYMVWTSTLGSPRRNEKEREHMSRIMLLDFETLGDELRIRRAVRGLTVMDLAKKVNVHTNTVYQIEHGKLVPSKALEARLREALALG